MICNLSRRPQTVHYYTTKHSNVYPHMSIGSGLSAKTKKTDVMPKISIAVLLFFMTFDPNGHLSRIPGSDIFFEIVIGYLWRKKMVLLVSYPGKLVSWSYRRHMTKRIVVKPQTNKQTNKQTSKQTNNKQQTKKQQTKNQQTRIHAQSRYRSYKVICHYI